MTVVPRSSRPLDELARQSVRVLIAGQSRSGALVASPTFPTYGYSWLRDGAFCAEALDAAGESPAAAAFHRWAARSIEAHRPLVEAAIAASANGEARQATLMPPARYTLEGALEAAADEPWPNFQIDGYGMWLWSLERHLVGRRPEADALPTVQLVADYLAGCWQLRCFNCWEEFESGEHASTLAAVAAGLGAAARLLESDGIGQAASAVKARLLDRFVVDGRLWRGPTDDRVDGSLAWIATPFGVLDVEDPTTVATIAALREDLTGRGGGIYRYRGDSYYGGGQWLLLTSSLAWHERVAGNDSVARELQQWVRAQARPNGDLPEQVTGAAQDTTMIAPWVNRWGPVATPLLWSHAMYVLAEAART
jgi:GH15 family glucan-1,4-alpha-glucosidase